MSTVELHFRARTIRATERDLYEVWDETEGTLSRPMPATELRPGQSVPYLGTLLGRREIVETEQIELTREMETSDERDEDDISTTGRCS